MVIGLIKGLAAVGQWYSEFVPAPQAGEGERFTALQRNIHWVFASFPSAIRKTVRKDEAAMGIH